MEQPKIIGTFQATTFDWKIIDFVVKTDGIHCEYLNEQNNKKLPPIKLMFLKPNFEYSFCGNRVCSNKRKFRRSGTEQSLIEEFVISDELLDYMGEFKLVTYSMEMAEFYDLNPKYAYDWGKARHYELGQKEGKVKRKARFSAIKRTGNFD